MNKSKPIITLVCPPKYQSIVRVYGSNPIVIQIIRQALPPKPPKTRA